MRKTERVRSGLTRGNLSRGEIMDMLVLCDSCIEVATEEGSSLEPQCQE